MNEICKILWHISDTHGLHNQLHIPKADIVIHSGDCSNTKNAHINSNEIIQFLEWYSQIQIPIKILVAGNHDTSIEKRLITPEQIEDYGIIYIENNTRILNINNQQIKIWASPITPTYNQGWSWNMPRHKIHQIWQTIDPQADIIVTHGPPQGILDLTYDQQNKLTMVGCKSLSNHIKRIQPKLHLFGHVHNSNKINHNTGTYLYQQTLYSNASCAKDGQTDKIEYHGNILPLA